MHVCFRADDVIPTALVQTPGTRPRALHLWISIQAGIQIAHTLMNACIATPKTPDGVIAFTFPAHLFRVGEEPMLRGRIHEDQDGNRKEASGLVDSTGTPV